MDERLETLQTSISHRFSQVKLLETALTHSSCANERPAGVEHNERLEYLGDAVLELAVSEELYRLFPDTAEGALTRMRARLVNEPTLAEVARELGIPALLRLGRGEEMQGGRERPALLADALEAVFGAVFCDGGYLAAAACVRAVFAGRWPAEPVRPRAKDAKSRLQEETQFRFKARPVYALVSASGPEHEKVYAVELTLPDGRRIAASGPSIKKAEHSAAEQALELLARDGR
ncbi:MAG: ribonuclease III [Thermodesulfobacteriota bacterium]